MMRTVKVLLTLAALVGAMLGTAGPAAASAPRWQVRNASTGASYGSSTGAALTNAIAAAGAGDRLVVAGTCTGTYTVAKNLTIASRNFGARRAVLDGNHAGGVLLVELETTVTLTDLVITHGTGGIANFGHLTLIRTAVTGNTTPEGTGGGILNSDRLTLVRSTVTGNRAFSGGGGIHNTGTGGLTTWATLIAGNSTDGAGGGMLNEGIAVLHKSLVTRNVAGPDGNGNGGGIFSIFSAGDLTLDRTRVVANRPDDCFCAT
jgi:hypothetical protein